ncbi:hypothetical protein [Macrococcus carouselicus]|uniref:Uncharacterized protein n=1 Tax=Macrococcus carouselicus TaxID=69969 RepID=A0A9Q8FQ35_9STAP|nr:hypothetical protein [Macrococcus carouselicus]TDM03637.1 hypothetical protein ERX40_00260 [Macrococcus carouselicus]
MTVCMFSLLYFPGTIFYVKTRIREKNRDYKWLSFSYPLSLVIADFSIHWLLGFAVIPSLICVIMFYGKNYKPMKIGIVEIENACFITLGVVIYFIH